MATFYLSFYRKSPRTHYAAPPLPKKLTLFVGPDICFCCKDRDSNRAIRRIETVRWTVSLPAGVPKKALAFNGRIPTSAPRRHGLHIVRDDFFISKKSSVHLFRRSSFPQKAYAFRGPRISQASYRLWRLSIYPFIESHPALITLLLLSPKSLRFSWALIFVFVVKIGIRTGQFEE